MIDVEKSLVLNENPTFAGPNVPQPKCSVVTAGHYLLRMTVKLHAVDLVVVSHECRADLAP